MEMKKQVAWTAIDLGLKELMAGNDTLSDKDLKVKSGRLKCLSDFAETLRKRVDERIKGVGVGPIEPLFDQYHEARKQIDINA